MLFFHWICKTYLAKKQKKGKRKSGFQDALIVGPRRRRSDGYKRNAPPQAKMHHSFVCAGLKNYKCWPLKFVRHTHFRLQNGGAFRLNPSRRRSAVGVVGPHDYRRVNSAFVNVTG